MATLNNIKSTGMDAMKDASDKARHGVRTASVQVQKGGEQAYERARLGLQRAQVAATIGSALLQSFLHSQEKQARKNKHKLAHQARHAGGVLQDTLQPAWEKTQEVLQTGKDATQDTLQNAWETSQHALKMSKKQARKQLKKTRKSLKRMQKAAQENLSSAWETTQDTVGEGSQRVSKGLAQIGSSVQDAGQAVQKRYKHARRKRARARSLFRWGLAIGLLLAVLFAPLSGAETRQRLAGYWERYKQSREQS